MKRTLIALGVAAAVVAPIANAAPTVYGRLNVTVQSVDNDSRSDEVVQVASNASRIGVKGEEKLTDSLSAVYLIEWGFEADASSSSTSNVTGGGGGSVSTTNSDLTQRNRFLGLKHKSLGTIKAGKIDTLVKQAEGKIDQFGDLSFADIEGVLGAQGGPARADNVIEYNSPKIADLVDFNLQLIQGEETTASGTAAPKRNGLADGYSTSVVLSSGPFWATVAYEKDVSTRTAGWSQTLAPRSTLLSDGTVRVGASYELKDLGLTVGALYQQADLVNAAGADQGEEAGFVISGSLKLGKNVVAKLQHGQSTYERVGGATDVDLTQTTVGFDYNFSKTTKAFGFYSAHNSDNNTVSDQDANIYGIGLQHNF